MLCDKCNKREAVNVHYLHWEDKPLKTNHRETAKKHPEWFQNLCVLCHCDAHGTSPKKSELKRLVIFRDRAIRERTVVNNQIKGFNRIEYIVPDEWEDNLVKWNKVVNKFERSIREELKSGNYPILGRLLKLRGIGEMSAAKLIAYIDSSNFSTVAKLNRYCGLDPNYIHREKGVPQDESQKFGNGYLRKELLGIIGSNFKMQMTPVYKDIYDITKAREIELVDKYGVKTMIPGTDKITVSTPTRVEEGRKINAHADNRAIRKMMQVFIQHYYCNDREANGLSVEKPYSNNIESPW